jgi:uncharacterized protein YegL
MTDKNLTEIVVIIDRSGSMFGLTKDTIGGFNSFLTEQKKNTTGKVKLSLIQFDDKYQIDYDGVDINDVKELTTETYTPRGSTALLDAVGKTIVTVGERLAKTPEEERPGQVIFLIITDGAENASSEYIAPGRVAEMVKHQTEKYSWTFTFMGGGSAAFEQAKHIGICMNNSYLYSANPNGTANVYTSFSNGISRRRDAVQKGLDICATESLLSADEIKCLVTD